MAKDKDKDKGKLETFRIADKRQPVVRTFKPGGAAAKDSKEPEEPASVGFPAVESRLEKSTVEAIAEELRPSYEKLEELASSGDMKKKAAAKKAMGAYERTADLFEYLFSTKDSIRK